MATVRPTDPTPQLWLNCSEPAGIERIDTTYAVIDLTPEWAESVCRRVALMQRLRAETNPPVLYEMEYWDSTPQWVIRPDTDAMSETEAEVVEALCDDIEANTAIYTEPGHAWYPTEADEQSVECVTMRVQEDLVFWTAYVRHTPCKLTTTEIPLADLECYARGALPTHAVVTAYDPLDATDDPSGDREYVDDNGMAVNLREYADEESNPFDHQSGPNGCLVTCPACVWDAMNDDQDMFPSPERKPQ